MLRRRLALLVLPLHVGLAQRFEINEALMRSTFKIYGPGGVGTAFIMAKPKVDDPKHGWYVLITAAHVLDSLRGDSVTLVLRKKQGNSYARLTHSVRIRDGQQKLWTAHPTADVAVMYVALPEG